MTNNSEESVKIYTHYYHTNFKTIVVVSYFDNDKCSSYSFITEGKVTERIIQSLDSIYIDKAICLKGFYFNDVFISMKRITNYCVVTINGVQYKLEYDYNK